MELFFRDCYVILQLKSFLAPKEQMRAYILRYKEGGGYDEHQPRNY